MKVSPGHVEIPDESFFLEYPGDGHLVLGMGDHHRIPTHLDGVSDPGQHVAHWIAYWHILNLNS